jgi:drug/metabolite transporter (DMT)-like permease
VSVRGTEVASIDGKRRLWPTLLGMVGVALWATETTLITYTTAIPPLQTVTIAFACAALLSPLFWFATRTGPLDAFRQPPRVWLLTVGSLAGYHSSIYYATQQAPPAAAALLQGTTPLMIVMGSALLPGERLRWWHVVGAALGLCGVMMLIEFGSEDAASGSDPVFYLSLIGIAAGLWGLYSVASRCLPEVPSSVLGVFYAACAAILAGAHLAVESWVTPNISEWAAMAGLGIIPMGLAICFWDYGVKNGDIQALGAFSYVEPFIGAVLVALFTSGTLGVHLLWSGALVLGGAALASASLWWLEPQEMPGSRDRPGNASTARERRPDLGARNSSRRT